MSYEGAVSYVDDTDESLVAHYVAGEGRAFDEIVTRYERRVYAVAFRMCNDADAAKDVTQDVFVSALKTLRKFRGDAQLGTWFHRVAVNSSLDHLRRSKRRRESGEVDPGVASTDPGPEELAAGASRAAEVRRALTKLSDEHRAVLVLCDLEGCDYAEVSKALDIPLGTVKSRIHRARLEMARLLGHLRDPELAGAPDPLTE